ncbi:MAG: hypothetical protein K2Y39_19265 [Candidatus Obscuribacterales bacterium]|nr:hypothetical protein [Candidatus Obscuribacterales bacterium]
MSRRSINSLALVAILAGTLSGLPATAQQVNVRDMSKGRIEMPVKSLFYEKFRAQPEAEPAPHAVFIKHNGTIKEKAAAPVKTLGNTQKPSFKPQQEKVEPGKIRWHKAIQTALDASKQSGKPVLLFQMMGRLDDRFC